MADPLYAIGSHVHFQASIGTVSLAHGTISIPEPVRIDALIIGRVQYPTGWFYALRVDGIDIPKLFPERALDVSNNPMTPSMN